MTMSELEMIKVWSEKHLLGLDHKLYGYEYYLNTQDYFARRCCCNIFNQGRSVKTSTLRAC